MAATFDRMEFVRALRGKPGLADETIEAMADALYKQQENADLATKADLRDLEQRMTIKGAAGLVLLGGFLAALKFFG
jgi:hypothetical protein